MESLVFGRARGPEMKKWVSGTSGIGGFSICPLMAATAEIGMSPVDSATGRDVPHTRLRAIVATPSGSTADQASPRRQQQHFRVRDPLQTFERARNQHSNLWKRTLRDGSITRSLTR
jgi:hypothetical protein